MRDDVTRIDPEARRVTTRRRRRALKEAIYEIGLAQLDNRPLTERMEGVTRRGARAAERLLRPTLRSPRSLARQLRVAIR